MRVNMPVTDREIEMVGGFTLVSETSLKAISTTRNKCFIEINGLDKGELAESKHNRVPHEAFRNLWDTEQCVLRSNNQYEGVEQAFLEKKVDVLQFKAIKKSLRVLPVITMASLFSSSVFAVSLSMSGVLHNSLDSVDDGSASSVYLASNSSRLAIYGSQAINNDFDLVFQYESGIDLTGEGSNDGNGSSVNHNGQLFTRARDSYVGLKGGYGQILFGHHSTGDLWFNEYNLFADQVGDIGNLWAGSGLPGRSDNVIFYQSPIDHDFSLEAIYIPEEGAVDTDAFIIKPVYNKSYLRVSGAYASFGQGAGNNEHTALALNIITNFSHFDVGVGFQSESDTGGIAGSDRDTYSIGGRYKINDAQSIKLQYTSTEGDVVNTDASMWAVGYDYQLNKNTTLYAAYAEVMNDSAVSFQVNGKGHGDAVTPALGADPGSLSFGIVYKFDVNIYSK